MTFTSILHLHKMVMSKRYGGFFLSQHYLFIYLFVCLFAYLGSFLRSWVLWVSRGKEYLHQTKRAPLCESTNLVWKGLGFTHQEKMP